MSLPLSDSSKNDAILWLGTTNEIDNPSNTQYVAEGDISCEVVVFMVKTWMARRMAPEEKMRGGRGGAGGGDGG